MVTIIQKENPILRAKAKEVPLAEITSKKIKKVIADMKAMLATQADGVAIAAPQIGESLRIFVVSGRVFEGAFERGVGMPEGETVSMPDAAYINPVITKLSKKKRFMHEGCLSVRPLWGDVERSLNASIEAYDETGKKFSRGAGGLLAHIFQHETDHLDGILFIDKAKNIAPGEVPEPVKMPKAKKPASAKAKAPAKKPLASPKKAAPKKK